MRRDCLFGHMLQMELPVTQYLSIFTLLFPYYPRTGTNLPNSEHTTPLKRAFVIFLML